MSTVTPRWVVVDDTDSGIDYTGTWVADVGSLDDNGNYAPPHLRTSHGTNSTASFSYQFSGTHVLVTGSVQFANPTSQVSWQCFVDGQNVSSIGYTVPRNNLDLCDKSGLTDGPHTLTVNVSVHENQTYWMDYIKYIPSATVPLDNAAVWIDVGDQALRFDSGWSQLFPGFRTSQSGSKLSFSFAGISAIYYGYYDTSFIFDTTPNTAMYSIDGQPSVPFDVIVDAAAFSTRPTDVLYNQVLFQTGNLTPALHQVEVTYRGTPQTTPLTFQFLIVQNGTTSIIPPTKSALTTTTTQNSALATPQIYLTTTSVISPSTTASVALSNYQSDILYMLTFATFVIYFLCGRGTRP